MESTRHCIHLIQQCFENETDALFFSLGLAWQSEETCTYCFLCLLFSAKCPPSKRKPSTKLIIHDKLYVRFAKNRVWNQYAIVFMVMSWVLDCPEREESFNALFYWWQFTKNENLPLFFS